MLPEICREDKFKVQILPFQTLDAQFAESSIVIQIEIEASLTPE